MITANLGRGLFALKEANGVKVVIIMCINTCVHVSFHSSVSERSSLKEIQSSN